MEEVQKRKLHAVCIPFPVQGHITPMLQLAKLLNSIGFHITFFNSEHNHHCLLKSKDPTFLDGTPTFRFTTFHDGLPPSENDLPRPIPQLLHSLQHNCLQSFIELLLELNEPSSGSPPIDVIISDSVVPFAVDASRVALPDCPVVYFTPQSPSSFIAWSQYDTLLQRGVLPFKDQDFMTNGSLDMVLESVPPSMEGMRLRDLSSGVRTTDINHPTFNYIRGYFARCSLTPIIFNTFEALDHEVIKDLSKIMAGPIFTIGPLNSLSQTTEFGSAFWKEDSKCLEWLDLQKPNSVVYASFGSTTMMTNAELIEFAWGLANSKRPFLWVIRPDMILGESAILPAEFENEIKGRGLIVSWCPQQKVLSHSSIAVHLTHCGWNSTLETISSGVPVICWPFIGDHQPINWWCCEKWGIGLEIGIVVERNRVEKRIREVFETEKGKELKEKVMELRRLAEEAISSSGSSSLNIEKLINHVVSFKEDEKRTKLE